MSKVVLGSGKLYIAEFTGTLPTDAAIEVAGNLLGHIQGGASLSYKATKYTATDDLGVVSKTIVTDEEAILKSGIMTWNGKTLDKLCDTARVTEAAGVRTVKIGGVGMQDGKKYVVHFVHEDAVDGDIRTTIVGSNQAGLELAFAKDKETIVNCEFRAQPHDGEGTLILYKEDIPTTRAAVSTK